MEKRSSFKSSFFKSYGIVKAMEENGYVFLEDEQLGSMFTFEKDGVKYCGIGNGGRISFFRSEQYEHVIKKDYLNIRHHRQVNYSILHDFGIEEDVSQDIVQKLTRHVFMFILKTNYDNM